MTTTQTNADQVANSNLRAVVSTKGERTHIASPHFKFPKKPVTGSESALVPETKKALPAIVKDAVTGKTDERNWSLHADHTNKPAPHFPPTSIDEFEGWSVQEVSVLNDSKLTRPPKAPASADSTATQPAQPTEWSVSSRTQTAGFDLRRSRIDSPHVATTGRSFADAHRRWTAHNLSVQLQAASISGATAVNSDQAAQNQGYEFATAVSGMPVSVIPDFRWPTVVNTLAQTTRPFARGLQSAISQLISAHQPRLLVAGNSRGQGTSTIAATIARLLIGSGRRVALVDADIARAGLTAAMELGETGSWIDQIQDFGPLVHSMAQSRASGAVFVGLRPTVNRKTLPPNLLDYLGQFLDSINNQFEAIVIDAGPISQLLIELSQPTRLSTSLLVVQHVNNSTEAEIRRTKTALNAFGISRLAIAQNFAA